MALDATSEKLGRYEILSELGHGAMGIVYKAIDPMLDRTVAVKTIKFDQTSADCAGFEERFYREAKSAGRLNHPNIVTIYDVGKSDDTAYIAMELLEGNQLKDVLDVHTALPIDKIVDTTGAGDLFAAGFLHGQAQGLGLEASLRMGAICAAEIISHFGARPMVDLKALMAAKLG